MEVRGVGFQIKMLIFLCMLIYYSLHDDPTQTFIQLNTRFYLGLGFPSNPTQNSLHEVLLGAINKRLHQTMFHV